MRLEECSEEMIAIRKELYDIKLKIAEIEKDHRTEGTLREKQLEELENLKKQQKEIKLRLSKATREYISSQNDGFTFGAKK